jgi:pimeloyl-ACP methyl ester carboxylesterase
MTTTIKGAYANAGHGQVHCLRAEPGNSPHHTPLVCLHPMPYAGEYFRTFMVEMGTDRVVLAPDLPGYGLSTPPPEPDSIEGHAKAMIEWLEAIGFGGRSGGRIDLLGYHTGNFLAVEIALLRPDIVRRLVLVGIPYFTGGDRQSRYDQMTVEHAITDNLLSLEGRWKFTIGARAPDVPLERAVSLFVSELQAGNASWWGFYSAFSYPAGERLPQISHPTAVLVVEGGLAEATRKAAKLIESARVVEVDSVGRGAFELGVVPLARKVRAFCE